jgi:glycerate 2-kinase
VVIAADKFKGTLTAAEVAVRVAAGLASGGFEGKTVCVPVADGGDGTVAAAVAAGFRLVEVQVRGPATATVTAAYALRGDSAVIEAAQACGLTLLPADGLAPLTATSYGVGQLILAARRAGARRIVLGVGGVATTDGGAGLLQALGARVLDARGEPIRPGGPALGGGALREVAALDLSGLHPGLRAADIILAADVDNPLTGPDGAAEVYGPQKGASPAEVALLDEGLRRWAAVVAAAVGQDWSHAPGAGAAGGVGFAARAVLGARSRPGIGLVLELAGFAAALDGADLVITGEGSLDAQSLAGKAPVGVARAAARLGIPVVAVAGRSTLTEAELAAAGIAAVYPLSDLEPDPERSRAEAARLLHQAGQMIARDRLAEVVTKPGVRA